MTVKAQIATLWREFDDEADIVGRLVSHGSTSTEDRDGQRIEQGKLRRADEDESGNVEDEPSASLRPA